VTFPTLTEAIDMSLLLHVPPVVTSLRTITEPWQANAVPVIAAGLGLTVTTDIVIQLLGALYVIVEVPAETPVTTPVEDVILVAVPVLLHVPPAVASVSVIVLPTQTAPGTKMESGTGLTVTIFFAEQPEAKE
jgi:hypothetical protein